MLSVLWGSTVGYRETHSRDARSLPLSWEHFEVCSLGFLSGVSGRSLPPGSWNGGTVAAENRAAGAGAG